MTPKIGFALLAASGMLAFHTSAAEAQTETRNPSITLIEGGNNCGRTRIGNDGRERKGDNYQACNEHATVSAMGDGTNVLMFRTNSKDVLDGVPIKDRAQLACAAVKLEATGPTVVANKFVTQNDGNQYRNGHAPVATTIDGGKAVAVLYNYRPNNPNNTQRYAQVFDAQCNSLMAQTLIIAKNNDDLCASAENGSSLVASDTNGVTRLVNSCGGNGNNRDDGWAYQVTFTRQANGTYTANKDWDLSIEPNEERTRMTGVLGPAGSNMVAFCASAGNNQPTDKGVRCYGVDTNVNGEQGANAQSRLLWRQYIAKREGRVYQTQIKLSSDASAPGSATATWQTLIKRNRRGKGEATLNIARLSFTRDGVDMLTPAIKGAFPGGDATHRTMVATKWGNDGAEQDAVMLISSSVNGSPNALASAQMLTYDAANATFVRGKQQSLGSAIDNAWISNIYGNNPNTQGRNHIQGKEIANPYYGVAGAFMPNVKSFVAIPATPRLEDTEKPNGRQDKLALQLVLVPAVLGAGVTDPTEPETPVALDPDNNTPITGEAGTPGGSTDSSGNGSSGTSLGGCSIGSSSTGFGGSLALLGLALFGAVRRRRRG